MRRSPILMPIIGSVLRHFSILTLSTADEKQYTLHMDPLKKAAIALIGLPHLGFRARARMVFDFLKGVPLDARILDAGAGYGIYSLTLAERGYKVDVLELEAERVAALNKMKDERPVLGDRITTTVGSLTAAPMNDSSYDVIVCSDVIEHIPDDAAAVSEMARMLVPGGLLVLTVPYDSPHNKKIYRGFGHERPGYTEEAMRHLIAPYGLEIEKIDRYEFFFGSALFQVHNWFRSPALTAFFFYPFYFLYTIDCMLGIGSPNGIGFKIRKRSA